MKWYRTWLQSHASGLAALLLVIGGGGVGYACAASLFQHTLHELRMDNEAQQTRLAEAYAAALTAKSAQINVLAKQAAEAAHVAARAANTVTTHHPDPKGEWTK